MDLSNGEQSYNRTEKEKLEMLVKITTYRLPIMLANRYLFKYPMQDRGRQRFFK